MNRGIIQKAAVTALSLIITASGFPLQALYGTQHLDSYADSSVQNQTEDSEQTGSSVSDSNEDSSTGKNKTSESETSDQKENAQPQSDADAESRTHQENSSGEPSVQSGKSAASYIIDSHIQNGTMNVQEESSDGKITGKAIPADGYQLATIRACYREGDKDLEDYIEYNENDGSFSYDIDALKKAHPDAEDITLTATFINQKVWDGGVDLSWYDPEKKSFEISTPAQLAGLAAIVNGMVDGKETREDQIVDPNREIQSDGTVTHKYMTTSKEYTRLIEQQGGGVEDEVYRLPKARSKGIFAEDDLYNDMRYRTVHITSDINMMGKDENGRLRNFTSIGGKHALNLEADAKDPKVIDTRFQGVLDGDGHTISIHCNRYSQKGFGYSWNIGLVGYLGGGVDRETSNAKDCKINYAKENHPTVRNIVLRGDVLGRRCVGGIVGRIGETNYSCIVENCANYATVRSTDMRGCAGIVGAAWGNSIIRNCYNAGHIAATYDEIGGIVGSNGYNYTAADIVNCFNVGKVENASITAEGGESSNTYAGQEIGRDGDSGAGYTVENCLYLTPKMVDEKKNGFNIGDESKAIRKEVDAVSETEMNSADTVKRLNRNGKVFLQGESHPVLYFEKSGVPSKTCTITIQNPSEGTVTANQQGQTFQVAYGSTLELAAAPKSGYRLDSYRVNGDSIPRNFYTVTGEAEVSANFAEVGSAQLQIPTHSSYTIQVTRIYNGNTHQSESQALKNGDTIYQGDQLKVTGTLTKNAAPDNVNYEYSGRFKTVSAQDEETATLVDGTSDTLSVTGSGDVVVLLEPDIQKKEWMSQGDTSWYEGHEKDSAYVIRNARELAGMAKLISRGVDFGGTDFKGKTITLASDIDLSNDDGTAGERLWRTVGNPSDPFRGTFDGRGHTIRNINVNFSNPVYGKISGILGGLFGIADGAVIRNVKVSGNFLATAGNSGGIVGRAIDSRIENCQSDVTIKNAKETGGIVGRAEGNTVIRNCVNTGNMTGMNYLGGIVSNVSGSTKAGTNNVQIENCRNQGNITSTHQFTGGILSYCVAPVAIKNSGNDGTIEAQQNTNSSANSDSGACGGILGTAEGEITLDDCYNHGDITGKGYVIYASGLVGFINKRTSNITNSYNTGKVTAGERTTASGFFSMTESLMLAKATVRNCYQAGTVTGASPENDSVKRAAFNAMGSDGNFANNYVLAGCAEQSSGRSGVTELSSAKLQGSVNRLGSRYIPDVKNVNAGYPVLVWENDSFSANVPTAKLTRISKTSSAITIRWNKVTGAAGYEIYRATSSNGRYSRIGTVAGTSTSYTDRNRTPGGWYFYRIRVQKNLGYGNLYTGNYSNMLNARMALRKPAIRSVKNQKGKKAVLKWGRQTGASGIYVYRSTKKKSGFKKVATLKGSTTSYTNKKLKKKKTYYYKIRTYSKVNGKTIYSAYSPVKSVKNKK